MNHCIPKSLVKMKIEYVPKIETTITPEMKPIEYVPG